MVFETPAIDLGQNCHADLVFVMARLGSFRGLTFPTHALSSPIYISGQIIQIF